MSAFQKDSLRNTPSRVAGYDIIRTILPSCKSMCLCSWDGSICWNYLRVPSLIKSAFIYRGCTIWKLLIFGWLDVNEYWGSCWGRCMMKNIRQNIAQPSKNSPCKEACGWGSAAELVLVRCGKHKSSSWAARAVLCSLVNSFPGASDAHFTIVCLQGIFQANQDKL